MFLKFRFSVCLSFFFPPKVWVFLYPRDQAHLRWGQIGVKVFGIFPTLRVQFPNRHFTFLNHGVSIIF